MFSFAGMLMFGAAPDNTGNPKLLLSSSFFVIMFFGPQFLKQTVCCTIVTLNLRGQVQSPRIQTKEG
jgi:hypothetical protein